MVIPEYEKIKLLPFYALKMFFQGFFVPACVAVTEETKGSASLISLTSFFKTIKKPSVLVTLSFS